MTNKIKELENRIEGLESVVLALGEKLSENMDSQLKSQKNTTMLISTLQTVDECQRDAIDDLIYDMKVLKNGGFKK